MGKHEDPNSPKSKPFVPPPPHPDKNETPSGSHAADPEEGEE
ncbi:hypothetical protein GCM10017673_51150 [Streptosporangium violaceochromogenes]|nr:hypothetical protein GCM10017673_51150 [Streptosporangium violaceochromogenes]